MAEDWIKALADCVKAADGQAGLAEQERLRLVELVRSHGPSFFDALVASVESNLKAVVEALGTDATAGSISLGRQADTLIFTRPAFPHFEGKISLDLGKRAIWLSYVKENPIRTDAKLEEL